ncbi:hypothetical protein [Seohaeicola zhoushanensis]|uniref:Uncharacterized protein n=1 Tax=Seohaeicola zhoushanensis TaxID=1569283 RepID=A0A8J3H0M6_9RHOB|nr:hypothetical protein [Seohaeicola zhoushanensis]GHF60821.1 hypothetical protein GCM10017056_35240 [Seohaeicola zhoushanensis]
MSNSLDAQTDEIRQLMRQKLGVRGRDFPTALARAKRRLPKALRKEGQMLAAALPMADHPKLGQTLDRARLDRAAGALREHLGAIDLAEGRKALLFSILGSVAFNLLLVMVLIVVVLRWQGAV